MTLEELIASGTYFCNYQERSQQEVRNKLYALGGITTDIEAAIATLIERDLLNEERFAKAIARGKFRIKHFGRIKIIQLLRFHKISNYCINVALKEIDELEYHNTIRKLIIKKMQQIEFSKNPKQNFFKVVWYVHQRGFEKELIVDALNDLLKAEG